MSQEARAGESSSTAGAPSGDAPTHSIKLGQTTFVVEIRYRPLRLLGQGTYGTVCAASVDGEGEQVAIKKIAGVFDAARSLTEGKRTLREMLLLRHLEHENVSGIRHVMLPKPGHDVYIVSDKMDFDLQRIISSTEPLTDDHCRYFLYQMLRGLKYVHSANVVHRDLKPSNVLLNANCDLKICDFGLARAMAEDESMKMTQYVVTRWYRAPEILLLVQRYTKAVDVWSVGCIFGELLGRTPLFAGRSYLHQLQLIIAQLGTPSEDDMAEAEFDEKLATVIRSLPKHPPRSLGERFPRAPEAAIELLVEMLRFSPGRRITAAQALAHPYLAELHDEDAEPLHDEPFEAHDIEQRSLDWPTLHQLVESEVGLYRRRAAATDGSARGSGSRKRART
jgi:serine/threonine protein kinase